MITITSEQALEKFPACCVGAVDDPAKATINDLVFAVDHEVTMYAEDQDGCISAKERTQCVRYLDWLRTNGVDVFKILRGES